MKANIHPKVYDSAKVICSCGNTFTTSATAQELHIEVCNRCHPFFTGEMKFVDTLGRVEKFQQKQKKAKEIKAKKVESVEQRKKQKRPDSLKDMFELVKKQASS
ncbi:50S ribosomal protein L31 [Candidatus Curtissbacteria bacterium RIFCSPLOWO2_01_FULL_39_62]|uniref:Large ribosomal subunit protein bL31 n=2 Tax=Candidatus Curtissiibacteriota TaxID=1752717 RepID=A0A1F5G7P9_9BACT|nr:MAG: 50S ribosomal protein L31 [Candidatus Curtissbacteria bacterium RIFCSPHIGHO2_01_FULL_39_57]OGD87892.1 MAG: 50S ribosomal protein L31 [Candidatus Curtissbacteria bacterium RIFCSPHIGHO2_02_FULL_40_16b]OGD90309.1 MAG: 50S ribosomal protein L31 [Candidatus Curtissbacteria bacterium RIFCSPHIGHO2_12_FULL_38_37]OGD99480.1 MAG: 50S ribosomal protein L31 [Candidatus Curtissbacteria bacterium RIFCSPLOWO2_02_FULL_40_11]OGE01969.1 MAG: 50S ribosomal protein L31 [Candidatus Curtissbacteria bacterium